MNPADRNLSKYIHIIENIPKYGNSKINKSNSLSILKITVV